MERYACRASFPSCCDKGRHIRSAIVEFAKAIDVTEHEMFVLQLSLEEAIINAIKHGNGRDHSKLVKIDCLATPEEFRVTIEDEGEGFDPDAVPDPTLPENIERPGGRGVHLMKTMLTELKYNDRGNKVTMVLSRAVPVA